MIPGISEPTYTQKELDRLNADDRKPREFAGKQYTKYEALQRQRRLETTMRAQRQEIRLLQDGGAAEEDVIAARARYRVTSAEYARFSQAVDLPQQRERVTVDGLGNIGVGKYTNGSDRKAMQQRVGSHITGTVSGQERAEILEHPRVQYSLTSGENRGIMKPEGRDTVALENQRYGRNKDTLVNKTYIDSGDYRRKYDNATEKPEVNKSLYDCAKMALKHRSGTIFEDMYWIDGDSGEVILGVTDSTLPRGIAYTDKIRSTITGKTNIVTLHTHPSSMPPSVSDLNSCFRNQYRIGFVACHDGKVFAYQVNELVNERVYNMYIQRFVTEGYSEYDAQIAALKRLAESYDFKVWEVSGNEK